MPGSEPEWLGHVNASVLKIKLAMAVIRISSIALLSTFIEAGNLEGRLLSLVSFKLLQRLMQAFLKPGRDLLADYAPGRKIA